jgi:hypothetical protein
MAKRKKIAILVLRNNTNASRPRELTTLLFLPDLMGGHAGSVNAYMPNNNPDAALT